ncbi:RNA polymerase sigma factor [Piscinibacter sp.]|uniref:RNA polymerase sigma factor n=1 Tax=Piscinibacter sp. TaxID=1903157 RepID=UPI002F40E13F
MTPLACDLLTLPPIAPFPAARRDARGWFRMTATPPLSVTDSEAPARAILAARGERDAELVTLLRAAAAGNASAFERVYDLSVAHAHALARRIVPSADVEDVVADAYFQAWRDAGEFNAQRGSPVTWLLTIVRSRALDLLRRHKASPEVAGTDCADGRSADSAGPPDLLAGVQAHSRLHRALAELSAQERWVLGLAYYREMSHREVSDATGLPLGSVKSLILRAQSKLRAALAEPAARGAAAS